MRVNRRYLSPYRDPTHRHRGRLRPLAEVLARRMRHNLPVRLVYRRPIASGSQIWPRYAANEIYRNEHQRRLRQRTFLVMKEHIFRRLGRPMPIEAAFDREKARRTAAGLCKVSRGATLGGLKIKDLVNEGRP